MMMEGPGNWGEAASLAEAIFMARDALGTLRQDETPPFSRVSFQEIYRYATECAGEPSAAMAHAMETDPGVRNDLRRLLGRLATMQPMSRAAASSGAITTRDGAGFQMTIRESRADRDQIYLIIRLGRGAALAPTTLFLISDNNGCRRVPLPAPSDGVIQLLLDITSDVANALCDPKTDVFLR